MASQSPTRIEYQYTFDIYGTRENKHLAQFVSFVEEKYKNISDEEIEIVFNGIIATTILKSDRELAPAKVEKCRFLLENEFSKHFERVKVVVK